MPSPSSPVSLHPVSPVLRTAEKPERTSVHYRISARKKEGHDVQGSNEANKDKDMLRGTALWALTRARMGAVDPRGKCRRGRAAQSRGSSFTHHHQLSFSASP
jgi:hypothetical protein